METKIQLLQEFLSIGGNIDFDAYRVVEGKIQNYLETNKDDQLEDVIRIIKLHETELAFNHDFEEINMIGAPIFERLKDEKTWDIYDMRLIASVVKYAESCKRSCELTEIILKKAEEFENQGKGDFLRTKFAACGNVTGRLLDERYERSEDWSEQEIKELFFKYEDLAAEFSKQGDFGGFPNLLEVRRGLFLKDFDIVEDHLAVLKSLENESYYEHATDEVNLYKSYIRFPMGRKEFRTKVGKRIKQERERLKLSRRIVAESLGVSEVLIRFIENGTKGLTSFNLYKFTKIFDVSLGYLLEAADEMEPGQEKKLGVKDEEIKKWLFMVSNLTDEEAIFITDTMKNIEKMRKK